MTPRPNIRIFTQHLVALLLEIISTCRIWRWFPFVQERPRDSGFDLRFDYFARLAGVCTGTLHRHFPIREALAEAVYREEVATSGVARHGTGRSGRQGGDQQ
jgi:hypothetical protein